MKRLEPKRLVRLLVLAAASLLLLAPPSNAGQYRFLRSATGHDFSKLPRKRGAGEDAAVDTPESNHPDKKQNIPMGKPRLNTPRKD